MCQHFFLSRIRENISKDSEIEKKFTESAKNNPRSKWKKICQKTIHAVRSN